MDRFFCADIIARSFCEHHKLTVGASLLAMASVSASQNDHAAANRLSR
jgi:hypothetical protein